MDIRDEMEQITEKITRLQYYDVNGLVTQIGHWIGQVEYFHNELVDKQSLDVRFTDPSKVYYNPPSRPKVGQLAYFNLTRGFPKELYDGHWCYIFRDFKTRFLVIPTTSVKDYSRQADAEIEFDIKMDGFPNDKATRFHVEHMRSVDIQRLYYKKPFYNSITPQQEILKEIFVRLGTVNSK